MDKLEEESKENKVCLFKNYCIIHLIDKKVCEGKKGNYKECRNYQYYMEQDLNRERIRAMYLP